jgi:glycosyltransferase involved in cell wall biosynthesis
MNPIIFITKLDLGGMERVCTTLCNEWTAQGRAFLLYVSYDGGGMRQAIHAQDQIFVANRPARWAALGVAKLCRQYPDSPALVFSFELGVVLVLLKTLGVIRNRIILRESTAIMRHCSPFWQWLYCRVGPQLNGIIAQSQKGLNDLAQLFKARYPLEVIHNPCSFALEKPERLFERSPISCVRLLMIGRLAPMKGHVRVLRALGADATWCHSRNKVQMTLHLTIAGDGPCKDEIEATIRELKLSDQVQMIGSIMDVRPVYEDTDLFVMASDYEGLPNTLIEAIACGCRVLVVTGDGGTVEFMYKLGLAAFVFPKEVFESSFLGCVKNVLESDAKIWLAAGSTMLELVSPPLVANRYWDFLGSNPTTGRDRP